MVTTLTRRSRETYRPETFPREYFIETLFDYSAGEHVSFLAPTQAGKTTLAFELLDDLARQEFVISKKTPAVILVMKPRDKVVLAWLEKLKDEHGWKRVKNWPPVVRNRSGYMLWPSHTFDPKKDNPRLETQCRKAILDVYRRGGILFADEIYGLTNELDLEDELNALWSRGAGMGSALWATSQRPYSVPQYMFSQPEHLFLAYTPEKRDRIRFSEIGGIEGRAVEEVVMRLPKFHWLYIRRTGPEWCIVGP